MKGSNFRYRFAAWMQGRYGSDEFSKFLLVCALALIVLNLIFRLPGLSVAAIAVLIYTIYRTYSKNIYVRQKERYGFLKFANFFRNGFSGAKRRAADRKVYAYFKCPECKKILRVPKGKGKIKIKCPECGNEIIRKT